MNRGRFEQRLRRAVAQASIPGACVASVSAAGASEVWAVGSARLDPAVTMRDDHVFHLFSGTKLYTATALMVLVQDGRLDLDAPVAEYLPELPLRHAISVRQLASHDSGLPDTLRGFLAVHFEGEPAVSSARALDRYALARGGPPGRGAAYRNANYAVLGELISRVAELPYERFVTERVLEPLGSGARLGYTAETMDRAATGYIGRWSPMRLALRVLVPEVSRRIYGTTTSGLVALNPYELDTAAIGGLIGNVRDFLPLLQHMLDPGDGILRADSKREMLTLQSHGVAGIMSREGVGLGWKAGRVGDVRFWNHEGGGAGFCSETRLYPDAGLGIVVLMNRSQTAGLSRLAHALCESLRRADPD